MKILLFFFLVEHDSLDIQSEIKERIRNRKLYTYEWVSFRRFGVTSKRLHRVNCVRCWCCLIFKWQCGAAGWSDSAIRHEFESGPQFLFHFALNQVIPFYYVHILIYVYVYEIDVQCSMKGSTYSAMPLATKTEMLLALKIATRNCSRESVSTIYIHI